ncbi:MAG: hypothetical protein LBI82_03725 [Dysgonamonadaceae bacterium]|jgi:uncharacterized membrane protein|nr:hypothetical protein [Dysgonamonadaceae bacterium]
MKLKNIENYYRNICDEELIRIAANSQDLRIEAIPLLYKELLHRNLQKESEQVNNSYYILKEKENIRGLIFDRLSKTEAIEYEPIELKYNDKISDIFHGDNTLINLLSKFIINNKRQKESIFQQLNKVISLQENDVENIKALFKKKGKKDIIIGSILSMFFLSLFIVIAGTMAYYSFLLFQIVYLLLIFIVFVIGVIKIVKGFQIIYSSKIKTS